MSPEEIETFLDNLAVVARNYFYEQEIPRFLYFARRVLDQEGPQSPWYLVAVFVTMSDEDRSPYDFGAYLRKYTLGS